MKLHANVLKFSYFFYRIIDRVTKFSFIIFQILYILWSVLFCLLWIMTCSFFHRYQLYIAFYYSYVNLLTINLCDARVNNLVFIGFMIGTMETLVLYLCSHVVEGAEIFVLRIVWLMLMLVAFSLRWWISFVTDRCLLSILVFLGVIHITPRLGSLLWIFYLKGWPHEVICLLVWLGGWFFLTLLLVWSPIFYMSFLRGGLLSENRLLVFKEISCGLGPKKVRKFCVS